MITGRLRAGEQRDRALDRAVGRRDRGVGEPAARRPPARASSPAGQHLHLVGEHEVRDAALHERVLAREAHQLAVIGVALHRLRVETATSENAAVRSRSWNAPRPRTFDGTWPEIASTGARSTFAS